MISITKTATPQVDRMDQNDPCMELVDSTMENRVCLLQADEVHARTCLCGQPLIRKYAVLISERGGPAGARTSDERQELCVRTANI